VYSENFSISTPRTEISGVRRSMLKMELRR